MFINPSSLTLNTILSASGTNTRSATAYPFPELLPLSTPLAPPPNQSVTPSFSAYFSPTSRSPPANFPPAMPPSGAAVYSSYASGLGLIILSSPSMSVPSDTAGPTMDTRSSAGMSLPPSSTSSSNTDVSASLTSLSAASGITTSPAISSSPSSPLSTHPSSTSGFLFTSTPTSTPSSRTTSTTQTFSSPATALSYSSSYSTSSPVPTSSTLSSTSISAPTESQSTTPLSTTTVLFSTTLVTSAGSSFSSPDWRSTSTYTVTSVLPGQGGTTTDFVTTSSVLSTQFPGSTVNRPVPLSPGAIAAIVLGIVGAFAFSALWLFCARRRHRTLVREAAALIPPENHASGPLDDEVEDVEEFGHDIGSAYSAESPTTQTGLVMGERYAGILAALHSTERFGRGNEGGSTGGIYGSRHGTATEVDEDGVLAHSPSSTLPLHELPPNDPPYMVPLSPPPTMSQPSFHQTIQPVPPPSAYHMASRRKSSPGPDTATWFSGYSAAPSCSSYYAHSQTLGSHSGSGSVDALSKTRTGSEEPLLGISNAVVEVSVDVTTPGGISLTTATDPGGNRPGLGSAFGSPAASMYSPSSVFPALRHNTSGSYGTRSVSGSGSYGYARSTTPSSFDILRSVSSQGALSGHSRGHSHGQGFSFGFNRTGSSSSVSTGKKTGSNRYSFGVPPTSLKAWKDKSSAASDKEKRSEKQSLREKDWKARPRSWTSSASASGSVDDKQGRGSPVGGVRALLGRLRRGGHTPSPQSSNKDLSSPTRASMDVDPEKAAAQMTPPPIQIEAATPRRRRQFSFILSNPDPHPPSPYSGVADMPRPETPPHQRPSPAQRDVSTGGPNNAKSVFAGGAHLATAFPTGYAPSPAPTEESRLAEGLLHPRLRTQGHSDASLRDFEDYSRPIGGVVKNRLYSTTTFGTQDDIDKSPSQGTPVQDVQPGDDQKRENEVDVFGASTGRGGLRDSWFVEESPPNTISRHSPVGP